MLHCLLPCALAIVPPMSTASRFGSPFYLIENLLLLLLMEMLSPGVSSWDSPTLLLLGVAPPCSTTPQNQTSGAPLLDQNARYKRDDPPVRYLHLLHASQTYAQHELQSENTVRIPGPLLPLFKLSSRCF